MTQTFELVHSGIDSLYIAFQGALDNNTIKSMEAARSEAQQREEKVLDTFGPGIVEAHISGHGSRGGYAYVLDTGPEGETWLFKANTKRHNWNGFVNVSAGALLTRSLNDITKHIFSTLGALGFEAIGHAVNRIDYAMDFKTKNFTPNPDRFVTHSNSKTSSHYAGKGDVKDNPSAVFRGRKIETITIGKMPGRQLTLYDKRREAIVKKKKWWFDRWNVDPKDKSTQVWRLEVRLGKRELKERYQLSSLNNVLDCLGDMIVQSLNDVRYLYDAQSDSNVSRMGLHPLWKAALKYAQENEYLSQIGLARGQIQQVARLIAIQTAEAQICGIAIGLAAALGWSEADIRKKLPKAISTIIEDMIKDKRLTIGERIQRARDKRRFIR